MLKALLRNRRPPHSHTHARRVALASPPPADAPILERPAAVLACALVVALVVAATLDYPLALWLRGLPAPLDTVLQSASRLGAIVPWLMAAGASLTALRAIGRRLRGATGADSSHIGAAGLLLLSFAGSALLVLPLKHAIGRARPSLLDHDGYPYFKPFAFDDHFSSFPSAHAAMAGSLACSLGLLFPRLRALSLIIGLAIPVTRQFAGAHWASDTIVGWAIGTSFSLWLAHRAAQNGLLFGYDDKGSLRGSKRSTPSAV